MLNAVLVLLVLGPQGKAQDADPAGELLKESNQAFESGNYATAEVGYRRIVDLHATSRSFGMALFNLGFSIQRQKRYDEARAVYSRLLAAAVNDQEPGGHVMEAYRNYRPRASLEIAACFEAEGKWEDALKAYEVSRDKYPMASWCGNCRDASELRLHEKIAACQEKLGRAREASELYEKYLLADDAMRARSRVIPVRAVDLAIRTGRLDELERKLTAARDKEAVAGMALDYLKVLRLRAERDLEGLLEAVVKAPCYRVWYSGNWEEFRAEEGWLAAEAAECLAELGDEAVDFLRARGRFGGVYGAPALLALARCRTPKVQRLVENLDWVEGYKSEDTRTRMKLMSSSPARERVYPASKERGKPDAGAADRLRKRLGEAPFRKVEGLEGLLLRAKPSARLHALAEAGLAWKKGDLLEGEIRPLLDLAREESWELEADRLIALAREHGLKVLGPLLKPTLSHADARVRANAAEALGSWRDAVYGLFLVPLLGDKDGQVRVTAIRSLGYMKARRQAEDLLKLLKDPKDWARLAAAEALALMESSPYAKDIAPLLKDSEAHVRRGAVAILGRMEAREMAAEIAPLLEDENADVRSEASRALGLLGGPPQASPLALQLKDPNPKLRAQAATSLGTLRAKEHGARVAELLKDPDRQVRADAVGALGRMGARGHAAQIVPLLKDSDATVRGLACWSLGRMAHFEAVPDIARLLEDETEWCRIKSAMALARLGAREHADRVGRLLKDEAEWVRGGAAVALVRMGEKGRLREILALLEDEDETPRMRAAMAIGWAGAREHEQDVARLLRDESEDVRRQAIWALGRMRAADQSSGILRRLQDKESRVRSEAALALGALHSAEAARALEALEGDGEEEVRFAASVALLRMGRKVLAAQRTLLGQVTSLPEGKRDRYAPWLLTALADLHEGESYRALFTPADVKKPIQSAGELLLFLDGAGFRLAQPVEVPLWGRIAPGTRLSPLEVIERLVEDEEAGIVIEGRKLTLMTHAEALKYWQGRLK